MDIHPGTLQLARPLRSPVIAIGNFDGVHVGHQRLLDLAVERARERDGESVVLTFDPHPVRILAPALAPPLITTVARKRELCAARGIDAYVVEPFTPELAALAPAAFVDRILVGALGARELVVGWDFTYGRKRAGTAEALHLDGVQRGIPVHVVPQVTVGGLGASSTKIRELLLEGNVAGAHLLLGRDFDVDGVVGRGVGRGRTIGVPTANVAAEGELLPRPGVYAARLAVWDQAAGAFAPSLPAVLNLGRNPTFVAEGALSLECHVIDAAPDLDLYDRRVRVMFVAWLRGEERFPSPDALIAQIRRDIDDARRVHAQGTR